MEGQKTPLFDVHQELGARMVPFGGWIMPVQYSGILDEHQSVRTAAGLFDLCHMGEFDLTGPTALADIQRLVTNDVAKLVDGQALYTPMCRENGTIVDDLLVYRRGPEHFMLVVNAATLAKDHDWVKKHLSPTTRFRDDSAATALVAVQGPKAPAIVSRLFPGAADIKPFHFIETKYEGAPATVARTGYTGEDGYEIFVPNAQSKSLFKAFLAADVKPIGLGARDTLRLEARLMLYGNDISDETTPIEAGIGWTVKLDKGDFNGRKVIAEQKEKGTKRKLVGLKITGKGIARHEHEVVSGGSVVGHVTSGTMSPTLKESIALAYVPAELAGTGTKLAVRIRDKDVPCQVVPTPFYKRKK